MTTKQRYTVKRSAERGHADHGWLNAKHSFSFAQYFDPSNMGFRSIRVINQDVIAASAGFPEHPHENMEIFSYILSGALAHKDSMGNSRTLKPGMIQLMSAGTGVTHSEYNPSADEPISLLQIWIQPSKQGLKPSYTEWQPTEEQKEQSKMLIISEDGRDQSATIHQDVSIYKLQMKPGETITHDLAENRGAWLQIIRGSAEVAGETLGAGDALSTEDAGEISISAVETIEALLFDLN